MGWVKDKFEHEKALDAGAPKLWCSLRASMEKARDEFRESYGPNGTSLDVNLVSANLVYVIVRHGSNEKHLQVSFDAKVRQITVIPRLQPKGVLGFLLDENGDVTLAMGDKPITTEQASRLLLEPLLFRRDD
jgi:hypothetical protein